MSKLDDFEFLRIKPGKKIRLRSISTDSTKHAPAREKADAQTEKRVQELGEYQDTLYAEGRRSLLVVLQGMDASGKDGAVRKVFDAVNPTGVQVTSFKQPTAEELRHDFLWRCHLKAPPRGYMGVFNRSYYEDVLIVRVHADKLLPPELRGDKNEWDRRYRMICNFESLLSDANTKVVKFFLHISEGEQRKRFIERQKDPAKNWKLAAGDFAERQFWEDYQHAYQDLLPATSTAAAPWYIIPADHKWVRNYMMSHILCGIMKSMKLQMPTIADPQLIKRRFK